MQAERPAVLGKKADDAFQFAFELRCKIGPWFEEVLEVCRREDEHFARAVAAQHVVTLVRLYDLRPVHKILEFSAGFLREEIIGDTQRHLSALVEFAG